MIVGSGWPPGPKGPKWTAQTAIDLGLADSLGELRSTLRARYGDKVRTPLISAERGFFGRSKPGINLAAAFGNRQGLGDDLLSSLEARAMWSQCGL